MNSVQAFRSQGAEWSKNAGEVAGQVAGDCVSDIMRDDGLDDRFLLASLVVSSTASSGVLDLTIPISLRR